MPEDPQSAPDASRSSPPPSSSDSVVAPVGSVEQSLSGHPWFAPILEHFDYGIEAVDPRVHGADEMFEQALLENAGDVDAAVASYLCAGAQIARTVERFVRAHWGKLDPSWSILDFGCGYGRVTRFLPAALGPLGLDPERIWASDLLTGAVHFQRDSLGFGSFVSHAEPAEVPWPRDRFDLIYVGSLFTHLPRATFDAWLGTLFDRVKEDGALLFSVHDLGLKPSGVAVDGDGFAFVESSESREIDHATYGSTWVGPSAIRGSLGALACRAGRRLYWRRYPRALCGFQDLMAVSPREIDCRQLGCVGQVDDAELRGDKYRGRFDLAVEGWSVAAGCDGGWVSEAGEHESDAVEQESGPELAPPTVEVRWLSSDGADRCSAETSPDADRSDLASVFEEVRGAAGPAGWALEFGLPPRLSRGRDLLLISAREDAEWVATGTVLFAGTIDRLLLNRVLEHFRRRRDRVYELAETIEQVKQSRFWRARAAWFRVKRRLGWTDESPSGPDLEPDDRRP